MFARLISRFSSADLGAKLLLINLVTTILVSSFAATILFWHLWVSERDDLMRDGEVKAQVIARNSAPAVLFSDKKAAAEVIGAFALDPSVMAASLFLDDDSIFAEYRRDDVQGLVLSAPDLTVPPDGVIRASHFHRRHLDTVTAVQAGGEVLGTLIVRVEMLAIHERMLAFFAVLLVTAAGAIALANVLLRGLLRRILAPVRELAAVMHEVSNHGDYSRRAEDGGRDEIGALATGFNMMIEQIQHRDAALGRELAERRRAESQLDHMAHHDSVTGLPNRHFFNRCAQELRELRHERESRLALIFIDLDNFKYVNDNFGHAVGDALLISVAERLKGMLRTKDIVARLGGDEFAVLLDAPASLDDVVNLARKMLVSLAEPFPADDHELNVSASMGVAVMPEDGCEFGELLSRADEAMYDAKSKGKNNVQVWRPEMSASTVQRFEIEAGLRKAVELCELEVYYQPIIDLSTGRLAGMEALLRWKNPKLGFVSPVEFIPVAEDSRLIIGIGDWVLREASAQLARWLPRFGPLFVAVNVSARQFREPGFPDRVRQISMETGCPPELLELEVTESVIMEQTAETLGTLIELRERGFHLSLDDFGTGYSSLSYLKRFPLGKLKIDRSFVSDLPYDIEDAAIAQAIVALAQKLGMTVVAEGVETEEQADFLRTLSCTYAQGFHFGRPMAASRFEAFATENLGIAAQRLQETR